MSKLRKPILTFFCLITLSGDLLRPELSLAAQLLDEPEDICGDGLSQRDIDELCICLLLATGLLVCGLPPPPVDQQPQFMLPNIYLPVPEAQPRVCEPPNCVE